MTAPMTDRATAVQNAASLLSSFCGRQADGPLQPCAHDHTGDAQAFVRTVEQYAFPELLRELVQNHNDGDLRTALLSKIEELEARALHVEPR